MKITWFHKLMIVLLAFVSMMMYFVIKGSRVNLDLVSEKYYEDEVKYQEKINHISNANALTSNVDFEVKDGFMIVKFPTEFIAKKITGNLKMYYAPNKANDKTIAISPTNGEFKLNINSFKGLYTAQLDWTCENQNYFSEKKIMF